MKQKIFIGSSSESANVARVVKENLEPEFECTIWSDGFFEMNVNTYQNLVKKSIAFDYAIFIGGPDDLIFRKSKKEEKIGARDNVYFELGLYAGILSPERSFFLIHKKCRVASDLFGVTLENYSTKADVLGFCEKMKKQIHEEEQLGRITLLPSTSLAYGYYDNFLREVCRAMENSTLTIGVEKTEVSGMKKSLELVFPDTTTEDWRDWSILYYRENGFRKASLQCNLREFPVYIDEEALKGNELRVVDVPQTLRASFFCVDQIAAKNYTGEKEVSRLAKQREIYNFKKTLNTLIEKDSFAKKYVKNILVE